MDTSDPATIASSTTTNTAASTESNIVVEEEEEEGGKENEATAGAASMAREDGDDDEIGANNNDTNNNDNTKISAGAEAAAQSRIPNRAPHNPQAGGQKKRSTSLKELLSLGPPRHNAHPLPMGAHRRRTVPYWRLFKYADHYDVLLMLVGALAAIVDGFTLPMMVYIQSRLINNFGSIQHNPSLLRKQVSKDCLLFVYVAVVSWVASYFEVSCWMHAGERQTARIRAKYLRSVLRQDVTFFDCETSTPEILNHISADSAILQDAISEKVGNFIKNISHFIGGYLVAFLQLWKVALLMIPFLPFMLLPGILYSKAISGFSQKTHASYEQSNTIIEQTLSSIRTVYSFMAEERTKHAYSKSLEKVVDLGKKQGLIKGLAIGSNGIIFAIWAFLGWYGSILIAHHEANGGQVLTTGFALLTGGLALGQATSHAKVFVDGCTAAYKIFRIIDRVPAIDIDDMRGQTLEKIKGKLEFQHVSFSYPSRVGVSVLNDFNLEFCPGKKVALVGSSGSGKSTIISLIQRFYDPLSGAILLDGVNLKELQLKWLRQKMGLVSQEPALFATSIKDNLLYANEQASMDDIIAATTLSGAHNFISKLPSGYDTQVGERGIQLSGGQKQRIAIARAILRDPIILLLDEATSALDTESETLVNQALERASSGRTTILVAHRLSTIYTADVIAVLQHGAVAELWKHEDLLRHGSSGVHSALSKLQHHDNSDELNHTYPKQENQTSTNPDSEGPKLYNTMDRKKSENYDSTKILESMKETYTPSLRRLVSLQKSEWRQGLLGLTGAVGAGLIQPFYALLIGELASTYYLENNGERDARIKKYSVEFTCLAIAFFLVNTLQHYNFAIMGEYLTRRIREKMTQKILTFEIGWFDKDENSSGALCSRLASDANMVRSLLGDRISLIVQTASAIAASLMIGLYTSWRLALVMTAIQPIVIYAYFYRKKAMATHAKQESCARQHASQLASEAVSLQKTVTAFSMQDTILSIFESRLNQIKRKIARRSNSSGMCIGIAQFILFASWALDFWYGGQLVTNYQSSSGDIFKTFFVLVSTGRVLAEAGTLTPDMAKGSAALEFIFKVLDKDTLIDPENQENEKPEVIRGDVELKDVYFSYPSRPNAIIFHNFNLKINAGSSIALVGQSGSGKSTIIGLIERFYDPLQGKVLIDGKNIKSLQLRMLRQHIGLVNQEPSLFATTIRENILYGKPDCSEDEIIEAARAANAHSFISALPEGYSTMVGAFGRQLSGGQKQRIAIARAILKNPKILLLDEATSALDPESERKVQNALNHAMVNRTTVIVAHRLSTIKGASSIAVLQAGTIVEQGDHNQLMSKRPNGIYFSLVQHQGASA